MKKALDSGRLILFVMYYWKVRRIPNEYNYDPAVRTGELQDRIGTLIDWGQGTDSWKEDGLDQRFQFFTRSSQQDHVTC